MTYRSLWLNHMSRLVLGLSLLGLAACKDSNSASTPAQNSASTSIPAAQAITATEPAANEDPVLAALGNATVRRSELSALLARLSPAQLEQLRLNRSGLEQWLRERLAEKALYQQALAQNWDKQPQVSQGLDLAKQQLVVQSYLASVSQAPDSYPSAEETKQAFERNQSALMIPPQYRIEQLFFPITGQADVDAQMRALADEASKKAKQEKATLTALESELHQRTQGLVNRSETPLTPVTQVLPEVRAELEALKVGQVSGVVRSQGGWHVLRVLEMQEGRAASYEEVKPELKRLLREQRQQEIALSYLSGMLDTGTVSINGAALRQALDQQTESATPNTPSLSVP